MNIPHQSVTGSLAAALFANSIVATGMSAVAGTTLATQRPPG